MEYKNLSIPATLVHSVKGTRYKLEGILTAINEDTNTCTMKFGNQESSKISLNEVYINEGFLDNVKQKGQEIWGQIKKVVRNVKGFLLPVTEKGKELLQFLNVPVNVATMKLPSSVVYCPGLATIQLAKENNMRIVHNNFEDALAECSREEGRDAERILSRTMKEFVKPENENLTIKEAYELVCEKYYHETPLHKGMRMNALNEGILDIDNPYPDLYGNKLGTKALVHAVRSNILSNIDVLPGEKRNETAKPILIWGAPGIGKTTILKKAASLVVDRYGLNLDLIVMKCAGLKHDDFELPSTGYNLVGQQLAYSIPKTWLPVFDPRGLDEEQLAMVDSYYNSGAYRVLAQNINTRKVKEIDPNTDKEVEVDMVEYTRGQQKLDPTAIVGNEVLYDEVMKNAKYNGGILFFDEISRLRYDVTDIMMGLMGERTYQNMILASHWLCIAASNRMSDQGGDDKNNDFRKMWEPAKIERYTQYTYVPTLSEWLEWAREIGPDGKQNVDELFVSFVEKYPAAWYDSLVGGAHDNDMPDDVLKALNSYRNHAWTSKEELADIIASLSTYMTNYEENPDAMKLVMWTGRTWEEKVNRPLKHVLHGELFFGHPEMYEECFENTSRTRKNNRGKEETYSVQNLSMEKLETQLNKVDDDIWYEWADNIQEQIDPSRKLIDNNRLQFFVNWILEFLLPAAMGKESFPTKKFKEYYETTRNITMTDIRYIWLKGTLKAKEQQQDDNIIYDNIGSYVNTKFSQWKSNPKNVSDMINMILNNYLGDWSDKSSLKKDIQKDGSMENILQNVATADEIEQIIKDYAIVFTDGDKSTKNNVVNYKYETLFDEETMEEKQLICTILKNSEAARRLANAALYIAKLSLQTTHTFAETANVTLTAMYTKNLSDAVNDLAKTQKQHDGKPITHVTPANMILGKVQDHDITAMQNN